MEASAKATCQLRESRVMSAKANGLFISYSSQDKTFVNRLVARLRTAGVENLWYDDFDLSPATEDLNESIKHGIGAAEYFAIVLSPAAQTSQWVSYEIQEALAQKRLVLALVFSAPSGYYDFLRNPHTNDLLRGGRRKIIDFSGDFEMGLNDLLLVVAPAEGKERTAAKTLQEILANDDPDDAERAMSHVALDPEAYLSRFLDLLPELRNNPKTSFRVARAMAHMGEAAIDPVFQYLLLQERPESVAVPDGVLDDIPHETDLESGGLVYTGEGLQDVLRHLIMTGGNRAWSAQLGAQRCLVAIADEEAALRTLIQRRLRDVLKQTVKDITVTKRSGSFTDDFYDILRLAIETAGLIERKPPALSPWLIGQFASTSLWGDDDSRHAKDKLGSYIVECLSRIGSKEALNTLFELSEDGDIAELFFAANRAPNPWEDCFTRFGNAALDGLLKRLQEGDTMFRPFALRNLASLPNPRALGIAMEAVENPSASDKPLDLAKHLLRIAQTAVPVACDRILASYEEKRLLPSEDSELERTYVDRAVANAARSAQNRDLAAKVCAELSKQTDGWIIWYTVHAVAAQRLYGLYPYLRTVLDSGASGSLRGAAAIALARVNEIRIDEIQSLLLNAELEIERPLYSVALAYLGSPLAVTGLVDGLRSSFLARRWEDHEVFADALTRLATDEALRMRKKWYKRI